MAEQTTLDPRIHGFIFDTFGELNRLTIDMVAKVLGDDARKALVKFGMLNYINSEPPTPETESAIAVVELIDAPGYEQAIRSRSKAIAHIEGVMEDKDVMRPLRGFGYARDAGKDGWEFRAHRIQPGQRLPSQLSVYPSPTSTRIEELCTPLGPDEDRSVVPPSVFVESAVTPVDILWWVKEAVSVGHVVLEMPVEELRPKLVDARSVA